MQTHFPQQPFTLGHADRLGIARGRLHRAVTDGVLRRVHRGVYVRSDIPDTIEQRAAATALVVAPTSVVTDRTAAWIHGVDVLTYAEHEVLPAVESCVLRTHSRTRRAGVDGRTRDLLPADVMKIGGLKLTTPLRTALDLGCCLERRDALGALDGFMRVHGITRQELGRGATRYYRRRGVVQLRSLIPLADPRAESIRESWTRLAIHDAGLPSPVPQHCVELDGMLLFRLDLAYPKHRIAIEYDGAEFHLRTEEQRLHDAERRTWLAANGWTVVVVRAGDFTGDALDNWLAEVRTALRSAYSNRRW